MNKYIVLHDPRLQSLITFYYVAYKHLPFLIPSCLFLIFTALLYLAWRIHKTTLYPVFPFFIVETILLFSLSPLGISFGRPLTPLMALLIMQLTGTHAVLLLLRKLSFSAGSKTLVIAFISYALLGVVSYALLVEPLALKVRYVKIESKKLSAREKPIKIAHLSDIHLERWTRRERLMMEYLDKEKPDIIVLTGDYLNTSFQEDPVSIAEFREIAHKLSAPMGVYAVGGTGEPTEGMMIDLFKGSNVRILCTEAVRINAGGNILQILGIPCSHNLTLDRNRLARVLKQSDPGVFRILLYHSPDLFHEAAESGIDLMLTGHTHGGQIRLPLVGPLFTDSLYGPRYAGGTFRMQDTIMIASKGIGMEGHDAPRARFMCPPEIIVEELQALMSNTASAYNVVIPRGISNCSIPPSGGMCITINEERVSTRRAACLK